MRSTAHLGLGLLLFATPLTGGCGQKADPPADEGSSEAESEENSGGTDTGTEGPEYPTPLWERTFEPLESGRVHDLGVANGSEVVLSLYELAEDGSPDVSVHRLDDGGELLWSTNLPIVGERLCVLPDGSSYHVGSDYTSMGSLPPRVIKLDAAGNQAWDVPLAPPLTPDPFRLGIECKASDDSVLVVGSTLSGALLVHIDADGNELSRTENLVDGVSGLDSIALRADGQILVTGRDQTSGRIALLDAAGQVVESRETFMPQMGPWVASRGDHHAWTTLGEVDGGYEQHVELMGNESLEPILGEPGILASPGHMGRALAMNGDGRVYAVVPGLNDSMPIVIVDSTGLNTQQLIVPEGEGYRPSAIAVSPDNAVLFVAGEHAGVGWVVAHAAP